MADAAYLPLCEQGRKPLLIKVACTVGSALTQLLPELTDFVFLAARGKHVLSQIQLGQLAQMDIRGVVTASFPVANSFACYPQLERHLVLGRISLLPQGQ